MRILLIGGGTAGHVWPIIEVAKSLLKNRRVKLLYVGSRQGIERDLIKNVAVEQNLTIPFKPILVGKRRAYFSLSNYWDVVKTIIGIFQSLFIILFFRPEVIFAKGGFVTFPMIFWLSFFKIPLVIHESDVVMGKANLLASSKAQKICLGFPIDEYREKNLDLGKLVYTGIPVQDDFLKTPIKSGKLPKLLVTGGSQGSSKINQLISEILPELLKKYEVYHLSGKIDFDQLSQINYPAASRRVSPTGQVCFQIGFIPVANHRVFSLLKIKNDRYHLYDFTKQMPRLMRDADLIISRSGASTLAEISATGKPAIIIPLESAKGEHQEANAKVYQAKNAAVVLSEKNLTANSLKAIIDNLMADENLRRLLGHHARALFQPNAAREIIDAIFEAGNIYGQKN